MPSLIQITLYMEPLEKGELPLKVQRIVQIPVAPAVTGAVTAAETPGDTGTTVQPGQQPDSSAGGSTTPRGATTSPGNQRPPEGD